jgi:error-prone DNA polymerase
MVAEFEQRPFEMTDVPKEDPATYDMLCRGDSVGVFQVESRAQMSMLPRLRPREFYDLVIQVAIIRPGPIQGGMVHPYLKRRRGEEKIEYPSKALEQVLSRTLGVPLFQEQVMQIAIVAAGFTPGEADQVRRSMAAWQRRGGLDHFKEKLLGGMQRKGYPLEFAERIYQQILGFGSYGFPESHAASFALLVYVSAWLKCHRPAAFYAGLLNAQPMGFYAPAQLVNDARRTGVELRPVDVLRSEWDCVLEPVNSFQFPVSSESAGARPVSGNLKLDTGNCAAPPALRLGLRMVRGLAEEEGRRVAALRGAMPDSIDALAARAQLSRRAVNLLAGAGAFAALAGHRHAARWSGLGTEQLPGMLAGRAGRETRVELPAPSEPQDIAADYRALGLTLGRHPLALLRARLSRLGALRASDLPQLENGRQVKVAGIVTHRQRPETASGVLFISLEDETGVNNLVVWRTVQEQQRRAVLAARLMLVSGELQNVDGVIHVVAHRIHDCSRWLGALPVSSRDFH